MLTESTPAVPTDPAEKRAWIKWQLARRDLTFGKLAKRLGVDRSTPAQVLWRRYPRFQKAVAKAIEVAPQVIWPERYDAKGRPLRKPPGRPPKPCPHPDANTTPSEPGKGSTRKVA